MIQILLWRACGKVSNIVRFFQHKTKYKQNLGRMTKYNGTKWNQYRKVHDFRWTNHINSKGLIKHLREYAISWSSYWKRNTRKYVHKLEGWGSFGSVSSRKGIARMSLQFLSLVDNDIMDQGQTGGGDVVLDRFGWNVSWDLDRLYILKYD